MQVDNTLLSEISKMLSTRLKYAWKHAEKDKHIDKEFDITVTSQQFWVLIWLSI